MFFFCHFRLRREFCCSKFELRKNRPIDGRLFCILLRFNATDQRCFCDYRTKPLYKKNVFSETDICYLLVLDVSMLSLCDIDQYWLQNKQQQAFWYVFFRHSNGYTPNLFSKENIQNKRYYNVCGGAMANVAPPTPTHLRKTFDGWPVDEQYDIFLFWCTLLNENVVCANDRICCDIYFVKRL